MISRKQHRRARRAANRARGQVHALTQMLRSCTNWEGRVFGAEKIAAARDKAAAAAEAGAVLTEEQARFQVQTLRERLNKVPRFIRWLCGA